MSLLQIELAVICTFTVLFMAQLCALIRMKMIHKIERLFYYSYYFLVNMEIVTKMSSILYLDL